jgi:hypothetical protein
MGYKQRIYTPEELEIISTDVLTNEEICAKLSMSIATLYRLRRKLGIKVGPGRGMKSGVKRPWLLKREVRICKKM